MHRFHSSLTGVSALASVSAIALSAALGAGPEAALAAGAPADQSNSVATLGEVVVTAQKRSEPMKTVPAAITVVQTKQLQTAGVTEIRDLNGLVPGLLVQGSVGSGEFVTRGLDSTADSSPVTGVQVDGIPIGPVANAAAGAYQLPELDASSISNVEVLKGPQGTLFGGSTLGGIVQFVTKKPNLDVAGGSIYAEGSGTENGGDNYIRRGSFSTPVVQDKLGFQISAYDNDLSGFLDDRTLGAKDFDYHRSRGGRAALLWQVNPDFQVEVFDLYSKLRSSMDMLPYTRGGQPQGGDLVNNDGILPIYDSSFNMPALHATYDLHWATLTYVGSYQSASSYYLASYGQTNLGALVPGALEKSFGGLVPVPETAQGLALNSSSSKYTSELRLASPDEGRIRWLVGIFYDQESGKQFQNIAYFQPNQSIASPPSNSVLTFDLLSHLTEVAGFGDVTLYITPQLDVTGGIRVGNASQNYEELSGGADFTALNGLYGYYGLAPQPASSGVQTASQNIKTYLANVRYHITPNDMMYFRYATGFRVGGPNFLVAGLPPTFAPDTTQDFEGGWKGNFWNNRGYLDLSVYYINWDNMQVQTSSPSGLNGITNGGQSVSRGVEASVNLAPIPGLSLTASGAYDDAHLTEVSVASVGAPGDPLPNASKWSGTLSANYDWNVGDDWQPFVGCQARYVDSRHYSFEHSSSYVDYIMPAYSVIDIQAGVRRGPWDATVFARNLGDERAQLGDYSLGANYIVMQRPRTIGVSVGVHW